MTYAYLDDSHDAELNQSSVQKTIIEQTTVLLINKQGDVELHPEPSCQTLAVFPWCAEVLC